jgi:hypothetical protein
MNHLINRCVKSEFNDISLYMKKDSEGRRLSAYGTNYWVYIYFMMRSLMFLLKLLILLFV